MSAGFDLRFSLDGTSLVRHANFLVQVRRGELTSRVLDRISEETERLGVGLTRGAFVGVVEESAEMPSRALRERQRRLISDWMERTDSRLAAVILGDTVGAKLIRTVSRLLVDHPGVRVVGSVAEGRRWIEGHVDERARADIDAVIAYARRAARDPHSD
ncbi:MAG: hypothetical protein AB7S26_11785 [Sandaracinaceae bacterium]